MKGVYKKIFSDHWSTFTKINTGSIREVVYSEVKKMMNCGSLDNGYVEFKCGACGEVRRVGFTCKSRFCTSCGKVKTDNWVEDLTFKIIRTHHRHMVFTIPEELRVYFQRERELLDILPKCAANVLKSWFIERNKSEQFTPGIVAVIHTFGRDLKWNPHVHLLVTKGASGKKTQWKPFSFMPYPMLRSRWQKLLLDELKSKVKKKKRELKDLINKLYKKLEEGFYVYAKGEITTVEAAGKYVGRYTSRPAMAESRIIKYDGENVTFYYERHEDGQRVELTMHAIEFIKKLIIHIPEKNFKMIRYYGIYSSHNKCEAKFFKFIDEKVAEQLKKLRKWEYRILKHFGVDPLRCPNCNTQMIIADVVYNRYGSIVEAFKRKIRREVDRSINELLLMHSSVKGFSRGKMEPLFV